MNKDTQTNKKITKGINEILKKTIMQSYFKNFNKSKVFYAKNVINSNVTYCLTSLTMQNQESNKSDCNFFIFKVLKKCYGYV